MNSKWPLEGVMNRILERLLVSFWLMKLKDKPLKEHSPLYTLSLERIKGIWYHVNIRLCFLCVL